HRVIGHVPYCPPDRKGQTYYREGDTGKVSRKQEGGGGARAGEDEGAKCWTLLDIDENGFLHLIGGAEDGLISIGPQGHGVSIPKIGTLVTQGLDSPLWEAPSESPEDFPYLPYPWLESQCLVNSWVTLSETCVLLCVQTDNFSVSQGEGFVRETELGLSEAGL